MPRPSCDEEIYRHDLCMFLAICTKTYQIIPEKLALGMHNLCFMPNFRDSPLSQEIWHPRKSDTPMLMIFLGNL